MVFKSNYTLRYCRICEKNKIFRYEKLIGHSKCISCGSGYGIGINQCDILHQRLRDCLNKRIKELENCKKSSSEEDKIKLKYRISEIRKIKELSLELFDEKYSKKFQEKERNKRVNKKK